MKNQENVPVIENEITLGGQVISYRIKRSHKAKNVRLNISAEEGLEVAVPKGYQFSNIPDLLCQKEKWILGKLSLMEENAAQKKAAKADSLSKIRYLGKDYPVVVVLDSSSSIRIEIKGEKALFTLPENRDALLREVIEAWYRWAAKSLFEERMNLWAERMKVSYKRIFVKNQKTRWGSCSKRQNISLNTRIIMAPLEVVDYVIIHELAHLKELNHSRSFWQVVEAFCPDYRIHLAWLKKHGSGLTT